MEEKNQSTGELAAQVFSKADLLYEFIIKYSALMTATKDYGTGDELNMLEAHFLLYVEDHPGISVGELAKTWIRSKGAMSQQVKKLEKWGLVEKRKSNGNAKTIHLHVTEKGKQVNIAHRLYDHSDISETLQLLLKDCSFEEILAFYKVVDAYLKIL